MGEYSVSYAESAARDYLTGYASFGGGSAIERLAAEPMSVSGATVAPSVQIIGPRLSGALVDAATSSTFSEQGAGAAPTFGAGWPGRPADTGVKYYAAKHHRAPNNTLGDIATEDIVAEAVMSANAANGVVFSKRLNHAGQGYFCYVAATGEISLYLVAGAVTRAVASAASVVGDIKHLLWFMDRSGSGILYVNGAAQAAVDISAAAASITIADGLAIGAYNDGVVPASATIYYLGIHKKAAWLDSHLQPGVASHRYGLIC